MKRYWQSLILLGALLVWMLLAGGISFFIEGRWFDSLGYWEVFRISMLARFLFFIGGFLLAFLLVASNGWYATRKNLGSPWLRADLAKLTKKGSKALFTIVALVLSFFAGLVAQSGWMNFLQFLYQVPMGKTDPIFGHDISFYFFSLPIYSLFINFLIGVIVISLILSAVAYLLNGHLLYSTRLEVTRSSRAHLTLLIATFFVLLAVRFFLNRYNILYSSEGVVMGAGYADLYAWIPCYWILTVLSASTAILLVASLAARTLKWAAVTAGGFVLAYIALSLYPAFIQTFVVAPNELQKETPFIQHNIQSTLDAYKLDQIEAHDFAGDRPLTGRDLDGNEGTIRNIRLWDWRPLKDAYGQLQSIRLYYEFEDADVDRYVINNSYRQVMLSVRELDFSKISESAQNWINRNFQYTHGQGLCLSPVNEVTAEGLPEFFIKDIPPRSTVDLVIDRPEIYFGEKTDYPVFVRTELEEFDYPIGDRNATTTYEADRGLPINSLLMRLLFAWELGNYQILFTDNFREESRVLLHREIQERIPRLAPFLSYDSDPYIVIHEGRLVWIQDAYTTSNRYPYSEPYPSRQDPRFNYIRNSVKVVVDAYLGDVNFYISDPEDPMVQVYSQIYPSLFKDLSEMPEGLRNHVRYPVDFFDVQREMYGRYHMTDPTVFYNQEDVWEIPSEIYRGNEQIMESYYVIMSLPREQREEFILMIPYTPRNKNNMIAWLAARSDGEDYGKLVLYQFPKQELTYGPMQIEARIDQNPDISQLITLWSQKGSRVIRGNLLVIPIEESVMYVEPLYLQAEKSEIPELTRVIVVYGSQVAIGETLAEALQRAVVGSAEITRQRGGGVEPTEAAAEQAAMVAIETVEELLESAVRHYRQSQESLRQGDWTTYGEEQQELGEVLERLEKQLQ